MMTSAVNLFQQAYSRSSKEKLEYQSRVLLQHLYCNHLNPIKRYLVDSIREHQGPSRCYQETYQATDQATPLLAPRDVNGCYVRVPETPTPISTELSMAQNHTYAGLNARARQEIWCHYVLRRCVPHL